MSLFYALGTVALCFYILISALDLLFLKEPVVSVLKFIVALVSVVCVIALLFLPAIAPAMLR